MPEEYKFPDEIEAENKGKPLDSVENDENQDENDGFEIEIVDDTPKEDRNRKPIDAATKQKLENLDDSEEYSEAVKEKFAQYKKAWHEDCMIWCTFVQTPI